MLGLRASARPFLSILVLSAVLAAPAFAAASEACLSQSTLGLFRYSSQGPFQGLRQSMTPYLGRPLATGESELLVNSSFSNLFARDNDFETYVIDYETARLSLGLRHGLSERWTFGLEVDLVRRYGGALDDIVEDTHDVLGVSQGGRQFLPRDSVQLLIEGSPFDGVSLNEGGEVGRSLTFGFENLLHCGHDLGGGLGGRGPTISWGVKARYKSMEAYSGALWAGDELDFAAGIQGVWTASDFVFYTGASFTFYGDETLARAELASHQVGAVVAVEWRASARMSVVLQYLLTEAAINRFPFDRPTNEALLGFKADLGKALVEFAFVENVIVSPNGPDFGIHIGLSTRF